MTAFLPETFTSDTPSDDPVHVICCKDDDLALCGAHVPTETHPWLSTDDAAATDTCEACADAETAPCCPVQALRNLKEGDW